MPAQEQKKSQKKQIFATYMKREKTNFHQIQKALTIQ